VVPRHIVFIRDHHMGYAALLKPLHNHFWWNVLPCCYDRLWLKLLLYFLVYKLTQTDEDLQFSPQMVLLALRILNSTRVLDFCVMSLVWSVWLLGSVYGF
jgi:hypothetical protein